MLSNIFVMYEENINDKKVINHRIIWNVLLIFKTELFHLFLSE